MDKSLAVFVSDDTNEDDIQQAIGDIQYAINQGSYELVSEICAFVKNKDIPERSRSLALEAFACARHAAYVIEVMDLFDWVFQCDADSEDMVFTVIACMGDIPSHIGSEMFGERLRQLSSDCRPDIKRAAEAAIIGISPNVHKLIEIALDAKALHTDWCAQSNKCSCGASKNNEEIERVVEAVQQEVFGFIPVCLPEQSNE